MIQGETQIWPVFEELPQKHCRSSGKSGMTNSFSYQQWIDFHFYILILYLKTSSIFVEWTTIISLINLFFYFLNSNSDQIFVPILYHTLNSWIQYPPIETFLTSHQLLTWQPVNGVKRHCILITFRGNKVCPPPFPS